MASINDNNRWKEKIMKDKKKFAKKTIIPMPLPLLHPWTIWLLDAFVKSCTWALSTEQGTYSEVFIAICWAHIEKPKTHNSHPFYKVKYWDSKSISSDKINIPDSRNHWSVIS